MIFFKYHFGRGVESGMSHLAGLIIAFRWLCCLMRLCGIIQIRGRRGREREREREIWGNIYMIRLCSFLAFSRIDFHRSVLLIRINCCAQKSHVIHLKYWASLGRDKVKTGLGGSTAGFSCLRCANPCFTKKALDLRNN